MASCNAVCDEIRRLCGCLTKELDADSPDGERVEDILHVLDTMPMTKDLLKETHVGKHVNKTCKKMPKTKSAKLARTITDKWKQLLSAESKSNSSNTNAQPATTDTEPREKQGDREEEEADFEINLPSARKKIVDLLAQCFLNGGTNPNVATSLSYAVEQAINDLHPQETDGKSYAQKVRMLKANLQRNSQLRENVLEAHVSAQQLVRMTPEELATEEQRQARKQEREQDLESRRSDWNIVNRDRNLKAIGLSADGGEYKCSKCGSRKTMQHSQQTRSADEPMTVFVACLNCGKRWKTV